VVDEHVIIRFREPVQGIDPYDGAEIVADRHRLEASHLHIDAFFVSIANSDGELLAKWPTDKVLNIEWPNREQMVHFDATLAIRSDDSSSSPTLPSQPRISRRWSSDEEEQMIELFDDGVSVADIARALSRSAHAIDLRLRRVGKGPTRDPKDENEERMVELFEAGASTSDIARELDLTPNAIDLRLLRMGHNTRRRSD